MDALKLRLVALLSLVIAVGVSPLAAADTDPDGALYAPSDNALADVKQALAVADSEGHRALVVLGANWCHDSRALAARLNKAPLAEVIADNYELVFVDVGYYQHGRDVTLEFDVPNFYATPTVLIVDPATGSLVNDEDRHMWANAYRVDMPSSVEYFEKWASAEPATDPASPELLALYAEIDTFEAELADRVAAGYAVVGPMLEAYKADNAPDDFDERWDELAGLRMAVPDAIRELREEAERRIAAGEEHIQLDYPTFPPQSWE